MTPPAFRRWLAALAWIVWLAGACATPSVHALTLATWNIEWLMTPATRGELGARCQPQQPDSDSRALPCTPGRKPPPVRDATDLAVLARYADRLGARGVDVVALQEVDGAEAGRQVFRQGWRLDCFTPRRHPQNVGFAIRDGVPYRCHPALTELDVDGSSRAGADVTLYPGTPQAVRILAVHLKSGCFNGRLDRRFAPCERLRQQVPVVEAWIDARVRERVAFAVMGDFNRHLDQDARFDAGPDEDAPLNLVQAWSDDQPPGAVLLRATEAQPYLACHRDDTHRRYIDDILISSSLAQRHPSRLFARQPYDDADLGRPLSDHCPLIWTLRP
ncbi:hypothetical protein GTZ97_08605 [Aquabacterium fontiphilum]|uniref:endonuclease/exonuclease/phosphatase family protein n=1 Tax=Aquabacterium fontiphilum TaxID=450365 RepID=UPI001378AB00|nr:hypothetical protein [Aquabacterium fontiphilum]